MARPISIPEITAEEQLILEQRVRASTTSQRDGLRARIVLLRAEGRTLHDVAQHLQVSVPCVCKWSQRFEREGLDGLRDRTGRGRKPSLPASTVQRVIAAASQAPPGRARWSTRTLAAHLGLSHGSVARIWRSQNLKPHLKRTSKLSNDPQFEAKFWDVIGLYLDPPEKSLVLCCDEKTQSQALERTQPSPPRQGHIRTETDDSIRHGTLTLFAALNYLDGKLIYRAERKHTHVEWLRFLKQLDRETPKDLEVHVIADDYVTHKQTKVLAWLARRPRFHMHFTPASSSWMNLVERFFADITEECVRAGSFGSVPQLTRAITAYMAAHYEQPKPYRWKADRATILAKNQRATEAMAGAAPN